MFVEYCWELRAIADNCRAIACYCSTVERWGMEKRKKNKKMDKFKNKYRITTPRLKHWDYRWSGAYFVTICTQEREQYFGEIENGIMDLSHIGVIADILWYEIKNHNDNVELAEFVVMPNHIHGIIVLDNDDLINDENYIPANSENRFQNVGKNSLSSIVRGYKSAVTKHARRLNYDFQWQSRFHEHIIRDANSYDKIANYIIHNPENWEQDKFFGI